MQCFKADKNSIIEFDLPSLRFTSGPIKNHITINEVINCYDFTFKDFKHFSFISRDVDLFLDNDICRIICPDGETNFYNTSQDVYVQRYNFTFIINKANIILLAKPRCFSEMPGALIFYCNTNSTVNNPDLVANKIFHKYYEKYRIIVYHTFLMEYDNRKFTYINGSAKYDMNCDFNEIVVYKN
jgi:hypothetical protein